MSRSTFPVKIDCSCGNRLTPYFAATAMLSFLAQHGAPADLLLATVKCRSCEQVHEIRFSTLRWRPKAA